MSEEQKLKILTANDIDAIAELTENLQLEFKTYGLTKEVTDYLWLLPLASIYGSRGKPYLGRTLECVKKQFTNEINYFPDQRESQALAIGLSIEEFNELERSAYTKLFKGLDKNLPVPLIVSKFRDFQPQSKVTTTATTAHPTVFLPEDLSTSFNPKNLQRHYGYNEYHAKLFFKNFKEYFGDNTKVYLIKKGGINNNKVYTRNIFVLNVGDIPYSMWSYSQDQAEREKVEKHSNEYLDDILNITAHELPIPDLQTWKRITEGWFERVKGGVWSELDTKAQQRHIVNVIRHNSVAYDRSWRGVKPELVKQFHDATFDRVLRQILNEFPWLAEECKRQLSDRKL